MRKQLTSLRGHRYSTQIYGHGCCVLLLLLQPTRRPSRTLLSLAFNSATSHTPSSSAALKLESAGHSHALRNVGSTVRRRRGRPFFELLSLPLALSLPSFIRIIAVPASPLPHDPLYITSVTISLNKYTGLHSCCSPTLSTLPTSGKRLTYAYRECYQQPNPRVYLRLVINLPTGGRRCVTLYLYDFWLNIRGHMRWTKVFQRLVYFFPAVG